MNEINISLDDVKGIFKVLAKGQADSIFETRTLSFLREMNRKYGTKFDLFCTYKHDPYSLDIVSDKYLKEFLDNADWLRFGFHCYDEMDEYDDWLEISFEEKINLFLDALEHCTGQRKVLDKLRIHRFQGTEEICRILHSKGVNSLFAADDDRISYYLDEKENGILADTGSYYDVKHKLTFYKSCTRLEKADDIAAEINCCIEKGMRIIPVFTHECQMDKAEVREKFEQCCRMGSGLS